MVRKWPAIYFGGPEGFEKIWRRKNITLQQGLRLQERRHAAARVGVESYFLGAARSKRRYKKTAPEVRLFGETPGSFPARNWIAAGGPAARWTPTWTARATSACSGNSLAKTIFPTGSAVGERVKINGINYTVVGVLEPKGGSLGGDQDNFAVIPDHHRPEPVRPIWRSLTILVQARDQASYDDLRRGSARHPAHHPQSAARESRTISRSSPMTR